MSFINSILKVFVGDKSQKDVKATQPYIKKIKALEEAFSSLSHDELRAKTTEFKTRIQNARAEKDAKIASLQIEVEQTEDIDKKEDLYLAIDALEKEAYELSEKTLSEILPEAFAVLKETAKRFKENTSVTVSATAKDRALSATKPYITIVGDQANWANSWNAAGKEITWDMVHYDVQLIGGIVLHEGKVAEMQTGEGKTLVATLPLYLNALTGNGVHLVTVNDYLAKRDSTWKAPLFEFHGLTVDCIDNHEPNSEGRRKAYEADITYGTNNEFGFDYLRDNMAHSPEDLVQRKHNFAIVDEVDSVLIDDARTPLIISGPVPQGDRHEFNELKPKIEGLYNLQRQLANGFLTEAKRLIKEGNTKDGGFQLLRAYRSLPKNKALIKFLSEEGIKQLLQKTENQYMQDNNREMPKVDEALYFVIEEKNNQVELTENGFKYLSSGSEDENFFVLPDIGTEIARIEKLNLSKEEESEEKEHLFQDFSIKSERIHTLTQLLKAYTLFEKDVEYVIMDHKILIVDEQTGRIMDGRRYSDGLHQAIEAKENVKIEAATQTFATITLQNYFRMYRKLGGMTGTAVTEAGELWEIYKLDVVEIPTNRGLSRIDKEDYIYKTTREKFNAVIEDVTQLSQAGRPVLIGTTSVEISELLSRMLKMRGVAHNVLNAKMHKQEAQIVEEAGKPGVVTIATNMAGRGTDIKLTPEVKAAGGLAIIGTERHDSRRVDRQLRGRAGRQGDPGSSQFYVSLEDNLMRLFGSERVAKVMDRMGLKEGEVIQHSMMTKSIERAQKKVEENNFGTRKRLLEYDDVMNAQREVVYKRRRHALFGERLKLDLANMQYDTCELIVNTNKGANDYKNYEFELYRYLGIESPVSEAEFAKMNANDITAKVYKATATYYQEKIDRTAKAAMPIIKNVFEDINNRYERIVIPFTDGIRELNIVTDLKLSYESEGSNLIADFEKNITLAIVDEAWKKHLRKMDELKQSVQLAVHEQKDPLLIYKLEAFKLFSNMLNTVNKEVVSFLMKGDLPQLQLQVAPPPTTAPVKVNYTTSREEIASKEVTSESPIEETNTQQRQVTETIVRDAPKINRNDNVTIQHVATGKTEIMKYKKAENLLSSGEWIIVN
ncbi:preprotein translocase subunit SecA [Flavobacterium branchiophilum]|uniref:Protein translocase subunit SecA n=2 Tax=Flavobacterium branchiophilum TaxID=55197 RepID=G2Z2C0_FLABF|nr:preprotein translocase subunit SecA [Flavobacterium branchiophilum]PDS22514.1 preprotein translocase subunit SecA [Flavobacterium branchiophilum]CCB70075.1 Preprotein translocase SecA subunit [Flavobacterium branchiophilum FL-15]